MKTKRIILLPYHFQIVGCVIVCLSLLFMIISFFLRLESINLFQCQLYGLFALYLGLFLIGLAREKHEDEFTIYLRTSSAFYAMLFFFALKIILTPIVAFLPPERTLTSLVKQSVNEVTGLGVIFVVYVFMYKIRMARYNKESKKEGNYEE